MDPSKKDMDRLESILSGEKLPVDRRPSKNRVPMKSQQDLDPKEEESEGTGKKRKKGDGNDSRMSERAPSVADDAHKTGKIFNAKGRSAAREGIEQTHNMTLKESILP